LQRRSGGLLGTDESVLNRILAEAEISLTTEEKAQCVYLEGVLVVNLWYSHFLIPVILTGMSL